MRRNPNTPRLAIFAEPESSVGYVMRHERAADAARRANAKVLCNEILKAPTFNACSLKPLAERSQYPETAKYLLRETGANEPLLFALHETVNPVIAPIRFARHFIQNVSYETNVFTAENLRSIRTPEALCALAATGEIDWPTSPRCARAVYVLRTLVAEARS